MTVCIVCPTEDKKLAMPHALCVSAVLELLGTVWPLLFLRPPCHLLSNQKSGLDWSCKKRLPKSGNDFCISAARFLCKSYCLDCLFFQPHWVAFVLGGVEAV